MPAGSLSYQKKFEPAWCRFTTSSRIQQAGRDVHFASSHVILNPETSFTAWGRPQFGLERDPRQLLY